MVEPSGRLHFFPKQNGLLAAENRWQAANDCKHGSTRGEPRKSPMKRTDIRTKNGEIPFDREAIDGAAAGPGCRRPRLGDRPARRRHSLCR